MIFYVLFVMLVNGQAQISSPMDQATCEALIEETRHDASIIGYSECIKVSIQSKVTKETG